MCDSQSLVRPAGKRIVRFAEPGEAADALSILQEAVLWSSRLGNPIWPADGFTLQEEVALAEAGELVCGIGDGRMTACMRLQTRDVVFWPDDPKGEALYIHKVAVDRRDAGTGWTGLLVDFARVVALTAKIPYLRLDTSPLPRMLRIYSDLGFVVVDAEARDFGGRMLVRMQKPLGKVG